LTELDGQCKAAFYGARRAAAMSKSKGSPDCGAAALG
jgi:hypothetical protein